MILLALIAPALAYESEANDVLLSDTVTLYSGSTLDTDWLPDGSPIAVRFQVVSEGGAAVDMEGEANLSWPEDLNLAFTGAPGTGELLIDASLDAVSSVKFDLFGYTYEAELDRRGVSVTGETTFDPFLLDGMDAVSVDTSGVSAEVLSYDYEVFAGISLAFDATMQPTGAVGFSGSAFWLDDGQITAEGQSLAITPAGEPEQVLSASYVGAWTSELALTFTPAVSVCFPIYGCEELVAFDVPLTLASDDFEQAFPSIDLSFPLPVLAVPELSYDFGEVTVGEIANYPLPLANVGLLDLEGEVGLAGSTYFTVYPNYVNANPGTEDGVVVTFAPETEGAFSGTVLVSTNDPAQPLVEIAITGTGVVPDQDTGMDTKVISSEVGGCGCANGGKAGIAWILGGLLALARVRRRNLR